MVPTPVTIKHGSFLFLVFSPPPLILKLLGFLAHVGPIKHFLLFPGSSFFFFLFPSFRCSVGADVLP